MIKITDYTITTPKPECFVITSPQGVFISNGGMIWWEKVGSMVEVIPPEEEQYLAKLLHGHEVLKRMGLSDQ